jgi:hypothetical protein
MINTTNNGMCKYDEINGNECDGDIAEFIHSLLNLVCIDDKNFVYLFYYDFISRMKRIVLQWKIF